MTPKGLALFVRLTPKAARDAIEGLTSDSLGHSALKARVRAAPEDGKANDALCALLADALGLPKSRVSVTKGHVSRLKQVLLAGADAADIAAKLTRLHKEPS